MLTFLHNRRKTCAYDKLGGENDMVIISLASVRYGKLKWGRRSSSTQPTLTPEQYFSYENEGRQDKEALGFGPNFLLES